MASGEALPVLLVTAGANVCAIPIAHVSETLRPLPVERLPGAPPFVEGVSVIRGIATPVVDLARLLTGGAAVAGGRLVTLRGGRRPVALRVAGVRGVRALDAAEVEALPPLIRHAEAGFIEAIGTLDRDLLLVLRASRLVPEEVWQAVEAREARA